MFLSDLRVGRVPFQGSRAVVFGDLVRLFLRIEFSSQCTRSSNE